MSNNSDFNIIISAFKDGDIKAFESIYAEYYKKLCVFLLGYCDDKSIVEDVVQDVFLKLWSNREDFNVKTSISGYLYKASYNTLMSRHRNLNKNNKLLSSYYYTAMIQNTETDSINEDERLKKLDDCINTLPPRCKQVFFENKIVGLKYNQVAKKLNVSLKTVEGHISRALSYLKECMQIKKD